MPEPRRRRCGQRERHAKAQPRPLAGDLDAVLVPADLARAAWPEERRPFDARSMAAEIEVGRAALEFVSEEGVHRHVAVIDATNRAVPVHLHHQPRCAGEMQRAVCAHVTALSMWMDCALHNPPASSTRRWSWWAASASSGAKVTTVI